MIHYDAIVYFNAVKLVRRDEDKREEETLVLPTRSAKEGFDLATKASNLCAKGRVIVPVSDQREKFLPGVQGQRQTKPRTDYDKAREPNIFTDDFDFTDEILQDLARKMAGTYTYSSSNWEF